jgi:hypothetical protein
MGGIMEVTQYFNENQVDAFQEEKGSIPSGVEYLYLDSVIGSGYEDDVAKLAIEDKIAYRAARKNMQIHSAIVMKIDGEFAGFFTFEINHDAGEFCLLQSAMYPKFVDVDLYSEMVNRIIAQNTYGYPMIMTVSKKHKLEKPSVFKNLGFKMNIDKGEFAYMYYGEELQVRTKLLAHTAMTNLWKSTSGLWLRNKRAWNEKIEEAGERNSVENPKFASREGCWQGSKGFSNVVLSKNVIKDGKIVHDNKKSLNGNASVLDPTACEVIANLCMPKGGTRVYNPFGGGVQMGFVAGALGYEYVSSEIRQNQCDANNAICSDYNAKWIKSDSSTYEPEGMFDLCFSCPPYYRVEKYIDYDGTSPEGEINSLPTYEVFRDTLFAGYKKAIDSLKDNSFFVVMTGDSRHPDGHYFGVEAEHELWFRDQGLHIYNKIVFLESEFTRFSQAKKTLHSRKWPKADQKIYMFYKGDMKRIKDLYPNIGRL